MKKTITIICPVYNEEESVRLFYNTFNNLTISLKQYDFKYLFLDNCSEDNTFQILQELADADERITILRYSKNFGVMKSIYTGILYSTTDCCVVFDCDLQDPPSLLFDFINKWEKGYRIIYGKRIKRDEPRYLTVLRNMFKKLQCKLDNKIEIESGAWLIDNRVCDELRKKNIFEPYLPGLLSRIGFSSIGIPYERKRREFGKSKFNLRSYFMYATDGIVSGSILPLRISILIGIATSFLAVMCTIYFVLAKFYWEFPFASGVAANIIIDLFFWGIHFILLGIIVSI